MQLVRKAKGRSAGRDRMQGAARAAVAGFAVDARSARQMILEAVEAGARHCGPLAVSTLCAALSGKYAPAGEGGARAAAERMFSVAVSPHPDPPSQAGEGVPFAPLPSLAGGDTEGGVGQ